MGGEWTAACLGDFLRLHKGVSYQGKFLDRPGPRLLGLGTVVPGGGLNLDKARAYSGPVRDSQRIRPGEIFVALTDLTQDGRVLGSPALLPGDAEGGFAVTHHVARAEFTTPNRLDVGFLFYLLQAHQFRGYMRGVATGTTVRAVSINDALAFEASIPPLAVQRAIASVLGALDDKIELNRRMNQTLEAMARAIFKSWFVDFDPVRAKAEGRSPAGMDAETAAHFPDSFQDSPLGPIPEGWEVGTLSRVARNVRDGVRPDQIGPSTRYIALDDMPRGRIALDRWKVGQVVQSGKLAFRRGHVLFGKLRPYFKKAGIALIDGVCSTDIVVIEPVEPGWCTFVLGHVASDAFIDHTNASSTGTKMPRTNWRDMSLYQLALPRQTMAGALDRLLAPIVDAFGTLVRQNAQLAEVRDTLLPKLISGEVRVPEAERLAAEVL